MPRLTERRAYVMSRFDRIVERCLWVFVGITGALTVIRILS